MAQSGRWALGTGWKKNGFRLWPDLMIRFLWLKPGERKSWKGR